jgi:CRISPR-associated protein (TIGR03984 family)
LLAQCDDGVVWGCREVAEGAWLRSGDVYPHVSPHLVADRLQELRLFGGRQEVFLWADGELAGRRLTDRLTAEDPSLAPANEQRVLIGDRILEGPSQGFTLVGDGGGSRHAVPLACAASDFECARWVDDGSGGRRQSVAACWPLRLNLRHFFTQDRGTGAVRVAATRLVDVALEGSGS